MKTAVHTERAPPPAGAYSQAVRASGEFLFISGQTPRLPDGTRLKNAPIAEQTRQAMANLAAIAEEAGYVFARDAVQVTVWLRDLADKTGFDAAYAEFVGPTPPARAIVQSGFTDFDLEVAAVLVREAQG
ncbi:MAG: RidA family protein [Pseudochelatococcus sp.]|jgi:2-iminobutanoate/2-iminopropanoate deaminase|uniref:RidA family protein n=1 Tax=Pseudochelatococcus sp. TaxID=2020869 RepID=UPI003D89F588